MSMIDRLLAQLELRGLRVEPGAVPGELRLCGKTSAADADLLRALKAFKPALLTRFAPAPDALPDLSAGSTAVAASEPTPELKEEFFPEPESNPIEPHPTAECGNETCSLCGADVSDPETREQLASPHYCERGGSGPLRDSTGKVIRPAVPRCPHKPPA